ncbi:ribonuclease Oy-like [Liolophura sinensis]|uniref:ribonuclease Oy-like n=1 Tax=Liolophura sinensis TaxID=3198878 RepID=UPI0031582069
MATRSELPNVTSALVDLCLHSVIQTTAYNRMSSPGRRKMKHVGKVCCLGVFLTIISPRYVLQTDWHIAVAAFVLIWSATVIHSDNPFWSYFVYTQQWPVAACIDGNATGHVCVIPQNVTTWTIHGLWPSDPKTPEEPANCNSSWKFDERQIYTLEDDLKKFWPNLYTESETTEFWAHEWDKHGTCSTNLPSTNNEHSYFSTGLLLNKLYNLTRLFEHYNLLPGKVYKLYEFQQAINETYKQQPNIECVFNKEFGKEEIQFIYQIELCLDKSFKVIKCPRHSVVKQNKLVIHNSTLQEIVTGQCSTRKPLQYLSIQHL